MDTVIVARLKTGSIQRVVPYGTENKPAPPYVVVKSERSAVGNGWRYRITAHFRPGQNTFLKDYMQNELFDLLDNYKAQSRHGNYNKVLTEDDFTGIIANNDDGTISMERVFLVPSMTF
jgi:hypothetical protein